MLIPSMLRPNSTGTIRVFACVTAAALFFLLSLDVFCLAGEKNSASEPESESQAELEAYVESLTRYAERVRELMAEAGTWTEGFAAFGAAGNVQSFRETVDGLVASAGPLLKEVETARKALLEKDWEKIRVIKAGYGDELGRIAMLLEGMKSQYLIECRRKKESERAVEDIITFFEDTLGQVRSSAETLRENLKITRNEKVILYERRQYMFAGEYLIIAGKMLSSEMRAKIVALFPDAYKPDLKIPEDPEAFTGAGIAGNDPLDPKGVFDTIRQLQKAGDYRAVLLQKFEVLSPLYSARAHVSRLEKDREILELEYSKELVEKRKTDNLYCMVWRTVKKVDGKPVETMEEWVDEVSWRRYDHYVVGTKYVKRRGELEEELIRPEEKSSEKGK